MQALALDYSPWAGCRTEWASAGEFLIANGGDCDGLHSILAGRLPIDLLWVNRSRLLSDSQKVLPVFFSGAVTARQGKPGPFFSGRGIAQKLDIAALCIADPSLALDSSLELAWYAGSSLQATQSVVSALLSGIAERLGVELLMIGGSGGGFAALLYAGAVGGRASALVWNPQTDLLGYYRPAVRQYLRTCVPGLDWNDDDTFVQARQALSRAGIEPSIAASHAAGNRPRRLLCLQNTGDGFHIRHHVGALISRLDVREMGRGRYCDRALTMQFVFKQWGKGHDPLPKSMLTHLLRQMLDPHALPALPDGELNNVEEGSPRQPLSFRHVATHPRVVVNASATDGRLDIQASLIGKPANTLSPDYAFYVFAGKERTHVQWYQKSVDVSLEFAPDRVPTHVSAFAMDSFGQKISASAQIITMPVRSSSAAREVFILGSCVSRDAFAHIKTDLAMVGYAARTSLASAFHPTPAPAQTLRGLEALESQWQRRMVQMDLTRRLPALLIATQADTILLDLIDERFSLLVLDGVPLTASSEFLRTGFPVKEGRLLGHASNERMRLWKQGIDRFLDTVGPRRVIINRVFWASSTEDGILLDDQERIASHNAALQRMYDHLAQLYPFPAIDYPSELLVADSGHRWGLSPFHYVGRMYAHTMVQLQRLITEQSLARSAANMRCDT